MTQKTYIVEGRQFRTESDYKRAMKDQELICKLRTAAQGMDKQGLQKLSADLQTGKYTFYTLLGQDFADEVREMLKSAGNTKKKKSQKRGKGTAGGLPPRAAGKAFSKAATVSLGAEDDEEMEAFVQEELKRRERRRRILIIASSILAACCLGYFGIYAYFEQRTGNTYQSLNALRNKEQGQNSTDSAPADDRPLFTLDGEPEQKEVLEEFKDLLNKNKKLIGWLTFDDITIGGESGFPVMQTSDNEYYLTHNMNQEYDKNGTIFMDKGCDVLKPSTNFILYGHHMQSGKMFGKLDLYQEQSYCEEHPYIQFDTIYEKGTWQVMYVFRSRVYSEAEIVFKYYQFIDADSEQEFDSYMQEMAAMSLYDTGVTAQYGDQLLTLSTCDYQETDGRFVVVAKKVTTKE